MWIGIDFGTYYSSAALVLNRELIKIKDPFRHSYSIPSAVYIPETGKPIIGSGAMSKRSKHPERFQDEFKRDLGSNHIYSFGKTAEDLTTLVFRYLREEANKILQSRGYAESSKVVITVPATYTSQKRTLMEKIAEASGFEESHILEEPIAAAIYYQSKTQCEENETLLVYDLGAGTFDCTLVKRIAGSYKSFGIPAGLPQCGGIDFDSEIYKDFSKKASQELRRKLERRPSSTNDYRLQLYVEDQCRDLKHQLSVSEEAEIVIPTSLEDEEYLLTRRQLNNIILPFVEETIDCCDDQLRNAGITWDDLAQVLLVGGSSRIPYIKEIVSEKLGHHPLCIDEPELAISLGAAIYGENLISQPGSYKKKRDIGFYESSASIWA